MKASQQQKNTRTAKKQYTDDDLRTSFLTNVNNGVQISRDLFNEVKRRIPEIITSACLFTASRRQLFSLLSDAVILDMYQEVTDKGANIYPELHAELTERFPECYDAENRYMVVYPDTGKDIRHMSNAALLKKCKQAKKRDNEIPSHWVDELINRFPKIDLKTLTVPTPRKKAHRKPTTYVLQNNTVPPTVNGIYNIYTKPSVFENGVQYTDVFVNGNKLVENADELEIKTFMQGIVLGIYCANGKMPAQWHLFDAKMQLINARFQPSIGIEKLNFTKDMIYIETSMRATIGISKKQLMRNINYVNHFVLKGGKPRQ